MIAFGILLSCSSPITAFGGPEGYFSPAITKFGAFEFVVPTYFRRPTMEPFLFQKLPRFRGFFPWSFGVPRDISPNLT